MSLPSHLPMRRLALGLSAVFATTSMPAADAHGASTLAAAATSTQAWLQASALASTVRNVISCEDDFSQGTLRDVVSQATDGDVIDLHTQLPLACSTITLLHGEIVTPAAADHITFEGPSDRQLTLTVPNPAGSGGPYSRVIRHPATGYMDIRHLTITNGKYKNAAGSAYGGCIISNGGLMLHETTLSGCYATTTSSSGTSIASGGGAFAAGVIGLYSSTISGNFAVATGSSNARGGGIRSVEQLNVYDSTISANTAVGGAQSIGGGIAAERGVKLVRSTLDANQAGVAPAIAQVGGPIGGVEIYNSTISGNHAIGSIGAVYAKSLTKIYNSTIAFNTSAEGAAVDVYSNTIVRSSIFSNNVSGAGGFTDIYIAGPPHTLSGSNCVITSSNLGGVVSTITADPQLTPLAWHGGPTRTHALLATSPAIDQGLDAPTTNDVDQRGTGFARSVGAGVDIGAYERQDHDDEIFYSGLQ